MKLIVTIDADGENDDLTKVAEALAVLTGAKSRDITVHQTITGEPTPTAPSAQAVGETGNLAPGGLADGDEVKPEPEKPKRKRRTKAEIAADEAAAAAEADAEDAMKAAAGDPDEVDDTVVEPIGDELPDDNTPEADEPEDLTIEDLVNLVRSYLTVELEKDPESPAQNTVKEIIESFGAERVSKVAKKDIPAVAAKIRELSA